MRPHPLIPAEAGPQCFEDNLNADRLRAAQAWVPASAGMSGELR
jgi:hypothetical protein